MKEDIDRVIRYVYNEFGREFGDSIVDLKQQLQAYKDKEDKLREYITNKTHFMTENGIQYMCNSDDILQILNEGDK